MAKGKRTGAGHSARYTAYKNSRTWEKNRRKKLMRALKRNPENGTIEAALGSIVYRRKTPSTQVWSATERRTAYLFKKFTGQFSRDIFHTNDKISAAALMKSTATNPSTDEQIRQNNSAKGMFSQQLALPARQVYDGSALLQVLCSLFNLCISYFPNRTTDNSYSCSTVFEET